MSGSSKIEWTESTWNPVTGCTKVSQGCKNCYAERLAPKVFAGQMIGNLATSEYRKREFTDVLCHPERLDAPLHWKKPRRIFVNSMSDLFHEDVPDYFVRQIFEVMNEAYWHIYQVLTKRPQRMRAMLAERTWPWAVTTDKAPQPNVWLGVSVEDQATADERIPLLLQTPAAIRFLSCEPLLGPINLEGICSVPACFNSLLAGRYPRLDWVIAGGESGPNARPSHPDWFRSLRDQCAAADVPYFFKQWGEWQIASAENGHHWGVMPESGKRYTWIGQNGKTYNPSAPNGQDCWAMAKVGKKAAGRLLDGKLHDEYPA